MLGLLMMVAVAVLAFYMVFFKVYPSIGFRYTGVGERKGRAEYQRIKREHPDSREAKLSEAEFVENFVQAGPSPWKSIALLILLLILGLPMACVVGVAGMG